MATPDYSKIWASSSPLIPYSFSDADYLDGWNFLGAVPPDRRMFDAWQNQADQKMLWLKNNMLGYLLRQNNTLYHTRDIAFSASLPSSLVLQCTTAGTTAATEPDFSGATEGGTVADGSVVWTYKSIIADLSAYAKLASPAFTGTPTAPTPTSSDDSTKIATTAYVKANLSSYAPIASPAFSGTPTAPTPTSGDNSTNLATTAFVQDALSGAGGIIAESLAQNGYVKFKDGLIVQWGRSNATGSVGTVGVTFPISFPSACYSVTTSGNAITVQFTSTSQSTGRGTCVDGGAVMQNSISSSGFTCASERQISWIATGK